MHPALTALLGGILIGLASWLLLAALGRVAGVSGIAAAAVNASANESRDDNLWRYAFIAGLVVGGTVFAAILQTPTSPLRSPFLLLVAGALVGTGTVLGSGCTSGHGVCGLGRRSLRSLVATFVFMGVAASTVATVALVNGAMGAR